LIGLRTQSGEIPTYTTGYNKLPTYFKRPTRFPDSFIRVQYGSVLCKSELRVLCYKNVSKVPLYAQNLKHS